MAIAPVVIEFLAKGMPQVQQAFKSIQEAAIRAERAQTNAAQKAQKAIETTGKTASAAAKSSMAAAHAEARARIASTKAAEKELDRWQKKAKSGAEQVAKASIASAQAEAKARIRATRDAEKELDRWQRRSQQQHREEVRAAEKAAKEKARIANTPASALDQRVRPSRYAFGRVVEGVVGASARGVMAGLSRSGNMAMGLAGTAAQLGGGFSIADSVMGEKNMRRQAAILSASTILSRAGQPGTDASLGRAMSTDEVLHKAKAIGVAQAIDPAEVLSGFDQIKKLTGNLEKATQVMPAVAKIATATGADISETSMLAGNILAANPGMKNEDLEKQLRLFTRQGVVGGVEVQDFAKYGSRITAAASMYGGNKEQNEATLGAMAQMARQYGGASGPAEAMLGSQRFGDDVIKHAKDLEQSGIKVSNGKGQIRDAQSLILEMLSKTGGDVTKLAGLGLGMRGVRPLLGAAALYRNAGGGDKGLAAVKSEFAKYTSGTTKEEIDAANKRVLEQEKLDKAFNELRIKAGEELLPAFTNMLPALKDLIPALVDAAKVGIPAFTELMKTVADFVKANKGLIDDVAAHPVGSLIAWELTKSFASAGLPALLRGLFSGAFSGRMPVPGAGGGPTPPGTRPGGGNGAAGVGAAAAAVIAYEGYQNYQAGGKKAEELAAAVRSGAIKPEDAAKEVAAAKGRIAGQNSFGSQLGEMASNAFLGPGAGFYNAQKHAEGAGDYSLANSKALQAAIAEAAAAGVREGVRNGLQNNSGTNGAGRSEPIINR